MSTSDTDILPPPPHTESELPELESMPPPVDPTSRALYDKVVELEGRVDELSKRLDALSSKLDELEKRTAGDWTQFRDSFSRLETLVMRVHDMILEDRHAKAKADSKRLAANRKKAALAKKRGAKR